MTQQVIPEAFFDSLSLAHKLDNALDGFKLEEIHLFSYFSSFLYCYLGNSKETWPHKYIASQGYPFSDTVNEAINRHIQNGLFESKGEFYNVTGRGADEFNKFKGLSLFAKREQFLNAACTTSILIPYSEAVRALLNEPDLRKAQDLNDGSWLNQMRLYPQLLAISKAVGIDNENLIIPAVTWINYINETLKAKP